MNKRLRARHVVLGKWSGGNLGHSLRRIDPRCAGCPSPQFDVHPVRIGAGMPRSWKPLMIPFRSLFLRQTLPHTVVLIGPRASRSPHARCSISSAEVVPTTCSCLTCATRWESNVYFGRRFRCKALCHGRTGTHFKEMLLDGGFGLNTALETWMSLDGVRNYPKTLT